VTTCGPRTAPPPSGAVRVATAAGLRDRSLREDAETQRRSRSHRDRSLREDAETMRRRDEGMNDCGDCASAGEHEVVAEEEHGVVGEGEHEVVSEREHEVVSEGEHEVASVRGTGSSKYRGTEDRRSIRYSTVQSPLCASGALEPGQVPAN